MKTSVYAHFPFQNESTLIPDKFDSWFNPSKTAVFCLDMHKGHLDSSEECPCPAPRARDVIEAHNEFHAAARRVGIPIIHVQLTLRRNGIDDTRAKRANWRWVWELYGTPPKTADELGLEGSKWLDLMIEVDKDKDYFVKTKKRLSAFYPSDLEFLLNNLEKENVVITGTMTDCCVLNSAWDAANRDFRVIVPLEITRGFSEESEQAALGIISLYLGLVVDSKELVAEWNARSNK